MRKLVAGAFVSLDGVMQAPGGPDEDPTGGFRYGGWVAPHVDDVTGKVMDETFSQPFELVLGRKTYDIFAAHWPYAGSDGPDGGIARAFNATTKHVATRGSKPLSWQHSRSLGGDVVAALRELKKGDGPMLLIQGSGNLIQTLLAADLIDEFRLLIFPLVLGKGKRLFAEGTLPAAFRVVKWAVSPSGVVIATYARDGEVKTGSFAAETPSEAEVERRRTLT
jgi:dihydrofolate reductase